MKKMNDIVSITRSDNLAMLIKNKFDSVYAFCLAKKLDYSSVNKYINRTLKLGDSVSRKLEDMLGEPVGALDKGVPVKKIELIPLVKDIYEYRNIMDGLKEHNNIIQVDSDFITACGWNPNDLFAAVLNDESMEPTINENTQLFVSSAQKEIISNKVYALEYKEKIIVRRVQENLTHNTILLIPDAETYGLNSLFKKEEVSMNDINVLGRVVYIVSLI